VWSDFGRVFILGYMVRLLFEWRGEHASAKGLFFRWSFDGRENFSFISA
jgi:hypothetical protein